MTYVTPGPVPNNTEEFIARELLALEVSDAQFNALKNPDIAVLPTTLMLSGVVA